MRGPWPHRCHPQPHEQGLVNDGVRPRLRHSQVLTHHPQDPRIPKTQNPQRPDPNQVHVYRSVYRYRHSSGHSYSHLVYPRINVIRLIFLSPNPHPLVTPNHKQTTSCLDCGLCPEPQCENLGHGHPLPLPPPIHRPWHHLDLAPSECTPHPGRPPGITWILRPLTASSTALCFDAAGPPPALTGCCYSAFSGQ